MRKNDFNVRHLVGKKQKSGKVLYYWQPTKPLRNEGFLPRRLNDVLSVAITEAEALNREVDEWRLGVPIEPGLTNSSTLSEVAADYRKDPLFYEKADATQRIYEQCLTRIESWAGDQSISSISRGSIIEFHRILYKRKPAFANAIGRQMRIIFEFAYDRGLIHTNPARRLKMPSRPPRQQIWTVEEEEKYISAAIEQGHSSMALAVLLAVGTAQRQKDILKMRWEQLDGNEIKLRQSKTGQWVSVPVLPELRVALDAAPKKSEFIVCSEATDKPYKPDHFRHLYRKIAKSAGLSYLQFRDLRRTATVRLAEAGVSTAGITSISGHDIAHCESILETYLPRNSEMARQAMSQYQSYRKRKAREQSKIKSWKKRRKNGK